MDSTPQARRRRAGALLAVLAVLAGACGSGGSGSSYKEPSAPARQTVVIQSGNLFFRPKQATAAGGVVKLELQNIQSGSHTFVFDHGKYPGFELKVSGDGATDAKKIDLKPGTFTFYCTIPGHREAGMEGTLTVS